MTKDEQSTLHLAYREAMAGNEWPDLVVHGKGKGWEVFYRDKRGAMRVMYTERIEELP